MIIIHAEDGAIVTDPKEIYIDKDLEGHLHLYADLSNTDRIKAVKLTVFGYSKDVLGQMLETMYKTMNNWLFVDECPYYVLSMKEVLGIVSQNDAEAGNGCMGNPAPCLHHRDGAAGDDCFPFREDWGSLAGRR